MIAVGACGADGGEFGCSYASCGAVANVIPVDAVIRGCPPTPLALMRGILEAIGKQAGCASRSDLRPPASAIACARRRLPMAAGSLPRDAGEARLQPAGRLSTKQLPPPSRASQRTLPPWRAAICLTRLSPRPTPPACSAWPGRR